MYGVLVRPPSDPEFAKYTVSPCNSRSRLKQRRAHSRAQICWRNRWRTALLIMLSCCLLLVLSGCGIHLVNAGDMGTLVASPNTVTFGAVSIGQTASTTVSLLNGSSAPVEVTQLNLTGQSFSVQGLSTLPVTIAAGGTYNLNVQFNPAAAGTETGAMTVISNSSTNGTAVIGLSGTGTAGTPAAALSALSCSNASMTGSGTDSCMVTLNAAAPSGGLSVSLSSSSTAVTVPATVTVPANATSTGFPATVSSVLAAQTVTLKGSADGVSESFSLTLGAATATTLTVATSGSPSTYGGAVTFTATISRGPTGIVTFYDGGATIGTGTINGTTATLTTSSLIAGSHTITASWPGSSNYGAVTSGAITQVVNKATPTITWNTPAAIPYGTALGSAQLDASSTVAGIFSYSPAAGTVLTVGSHAITATFTPTDNTDYTTATQAVTLTVNQGTSTLNISTTSLTFGSVAVSADPTQSVTLTSTGTAPLTISSATVAGAGFTLSAATLPVTLTPGQAMTLSVLFNPSAAGAVAGQLTIASNSSTNPTAMISLSGTGTPVLTALSCSSTSMTGSGTDACTVTLNAAAASGGFSVSLASSSAAVTLPATVTVPANATSALFTATVSSVATAQAATLTASAGGVSEGFALQLNAAVPTLSINATSVPFGNVEVNSTATQSVTLTSTGTAPVTINSATLTGTSFSLAGVTFPATLNPGQTATLGIEFDPAATGVATGQLTIICNSSTNATAVIGLSGTGIAAVHVAVTPTSASVITGATQQFAASVTGTSQTEVTWTVAGTGCTGTACGTISSSGLYTTPTAVPSPATVTITATSVADPSESASADVTIMPPAGTTYYLATAADGGNDSNDGRSQALPWLSPNHSLNCGDVIIAAASTGYSASNFRTGKWGTVTCPAGNNVAWLKCVTFDACKISSSTLQGMWVDQNYWGVQGWEVTTTSGDTAGTCFLAEPNWTTPITIHHIIFANDVANGCGYNGFASGNNGTASVDYIVIVGNIAFNAALANNGCNNGIDIYQPVESDSLPGTHIYVAGNFSFGIVDVNPCNGGPPTDGEGLSFDTFDGDSGYPDGPSSPYAAQAVADNNILVANGGRGLMAGNNGNGTGPFAHI